MHTTRQEGQWPKLFGLFRYVIVSFYLHVPPGRISYSISVRTQKERKRSPDPASEERFLFLSLWSVGRCTFLVSSIGTD